MRRGCTRRLGAGFVVLAACACRGGEADRSVPRVTRSDSAGVPVYTVDRLPPPDDDRFAWTLELERAVWTGETESRREPLLYNPQSVLRMADGALVVLDAGELRLAVLAPDRDTVVVRFGRTGEGPGEVLSSNGLLSAAGPGSFWLTDPGNQRRTKFSLTGNVLAEEPATLAGSGGLAIQRPVTDEAFFSRVFRSTPEGPARLVDSVLVFDEAAGRVRAVAPMPPRVESRSMNTSAFPLFAPAGAFAPVASGGVMVGRTDAASFAHYGDDGRLLGLVRLPLSSRMLGVTDKPAVLAEVALEYAPAAQWSPADLADAFPVFSQLWPVGDSLFALEHTRWARPEGDPPLGAGGRMWRLFTVTGRYAGALRLPTGFGYPYRQERTRVVGIRRDELGVATIESYRLIGPGRAPDPTKPARGDPTRSGGRGT